MLSFRHPSPLRIDSFPVRFPSCSHGFLPTHRPARLPTQIFPQQRTPFAGFSLSTASCHNRARHPPLQLPSGRATPSALAADAACRGREGDPGRPQGGRSAAAGADITPATGRGRFAPTPRATRGGRGTVNSRDSFRVTAKRGVRGCRGCRGVGYPSHPMPRAGQATCRPLRATAAMQGRKKEEEQQQQ